MINLQDDSGIYAGQSDVIGQSWQAWTLRILGFTKLLKPYRLNYNTVEYTRVKGRGDRTIPCQTMRSQNVKNAESQGSI
jgi:hypothetical protein